MKTTPLIVTLSQGINPATALMVDHPLFVCPLGAEFEVVEVISDHTVAGSDGSAVTADLKKCTSTQAPASGTSVLSSTFDLKSTANTPVHKTTASGLASSLATRTVKAGERLSIDLSGTLTALAGFVIVVVLHQRVYGTYR